MDADSILKLGNVLGLSRMRVSGDNVVASCPFAPYRHLKADGTFGDDRRPSFGILIEPDAESVFHCFGCESKGTLDKLCLELGDLRNTDYEELLEFVWDHEGAGVLERCAEDLELKPLESKRAERDRVLRRLIYPEREYDMYRDDLPLEFAESRGLTKAVCEAWGLGHDPEEGRLMFPVRDGEGRLVGLKGRTYRGAKSKYYSYLNFQRGNWFYGEHMIRPVEEDPRLVIVEGEIDAIKVWMAGYTGLALMGGMPTKDHVRKLELLERPVVLFPDAGNVGDHWADYLGKMLKYFVTVYDVYLDEGDPGNLTPEEIRAKIETARIRT